MFTIYILYATNFGKYYIGQTSNLAYRLECHNELSENSYTSKYRTWELKASIPIDSKAKAMRLEKYLKKKPRDFIKRVIDENELVEYLVKKFG